MCEHFVVITASGPPSHNALLFEEISSGLVAGLREGFDVSAKRSVKGLPVGRCSIRGYIPGSAVWSKPKAQRLRSMFAFCLETDCALGGRPGEEAPPYHGSTLSSTMTVSSYLLFFRRVACLSRSEDLSSVGIRVAERKDVASREAMILARPQEVADRVAPPPPTPPTALLLARCAEPCWQPVRRLAFRTCLSAIFGIRLAPIFQGAT